DLLLGGAKLAGILIDASPKGSALEWLVIGIGVNLAAAPQIPGRATTSLADHGIALGPQTAAAAILARIAQWRYASPAAIRAAWLTHAHPPGTRLIVNDIEGRFAGLSPAGELLLETAGQIKHFNTGNVALGY
ncbi:MAG: biotin--[acetyl-CoA-carboxylase] ligase, partial [Acidocella sp.]|nr:biotin--[acetyl-CoA-carboxylase] ligase [Acidocella sp.]